MTIGVGTDIIEINRIKKAAQSGPFLKRAFTEEERKQSGGRMSFLAGCFAVKEAVAKCLGTGFRGFSPQEIECLRDEMGKPYVNLYGGAAELFRKIGGSALLVSISDTEDIAAAVAVLEGDAGAADAGTAERRGLKS